VSDDVAEFHAPQLLSTQIVDSAAEAVEAVLAADTLDLGVRVYNRLVPDDDSDDTLVEEWVIEIYTNAPAVDPDDDDEEDGEPAED
jgi:hypothetical protein